MSEIPAPGGTHTSEDEKILHRLGYAQELFRAMGAFQNFAISFTIISILAGCLTSYYIAFQWGGPVAVTWGWLLVGTIRRSSPSRWQRSRRLPDRRWSLLLVVEARKRRLGMVHRLVQPVGLIGIVTAGGLRSCDLRDIPAQPLVRLSERIHHIFSPLRVMVISLVLSTSSTCGSRRRSTASPRSGTWSAS